jgi:hypothetical protein
MTRALWEAIMNWTVIPADTTPEAWRVQLEIYRRMSPSKRLELALRMSDSMRAVVASGVRARHPEYDEEQIKHAVNRILLGDELFRKAFPGVETAT